MKKLISSAVCLFFVFALFAQKGIEELIQAEKNFAAYSVAHSTKEAFQKFIDSNSIMFDNGKPVKAIEFWEKREKNAGVLNWWPQYAEISSSGDFGYTTGPWTFQSSKNDTIVARGQYTTVWHVNQNGEWKFLVDLGISNTQINTAEDVIRINQIKQKENSEKTSPGYPFLENTDNDFLKLFTANKSKAYKKYLSEESILNRNGYLPAVSQAGKRKMIQATPSFDNYTSDGRGISPVPDMGYSYGTTVIKDKRENYLRIWRREKNGWKIAVEVLRY